MYSYKVCHVVPRKTTTRRDGDRIMIVAEAGGDIRIATVQAHTVEGAKQAAARL